MNILIGLMTLGSGVREINPKTDKSSNPIQVGRGSTVLRLPAFARNANIVRVLMFNVCDICPFAPGPVTFLAG